MNILVVDDSVIYRYGISKAIEGMSGMTVVGVAINGKLALDKFVYLKPDIITMDIEMPEMDGIATIKEIRKLDKNVKIIVFSDTSEIGAVRTLEALHAGANDFLPKSVVKEDDDSIIGIRRELEPKLLQFLDVPKTSNTLNILRSKEVVVEPVANRVPKSKNIQADLVLIGSSTGGPELLRRIFSELKEYKGPPILICQHMPPVFTEQLARMLSANCGWSVVEAKENMKIQKGKAYIAPGDFHMSLKLNENMEYILKLDQTEKVKSVRPAVDVLFASVAKTYGGKIAAFILTGMGEDGADGVRALKSARTTVLIQNEASSIVWGMPGAIHKDGLQDFILDASEISQVLLAIQGGGNL